MNKKIVISLAVIGAVAAIAVGATTAFFSDTETSTGNTFTAGTLDLKVDSTCTYTEGSYIGQNPGFCNWDSKDLNGELFFDFRDVKPGDSGEDTISLTAVDNDAYVCAYVQNLVNADNSCTEPEGKAEMGLINEETGDSMPGCTPAGELQDNVHLMIWSDTGVMEGDVLVGKCDNILQNGETVLVEDTTINGNNGVWSLGQIPGNVETCIGVNWNVPGTVGNIIQSDSVTGDIAFYAEQVRNNADFHCPETLPVETPAQPEI